MFCFVPITFVMRICEKVGEREHEVPDTLQKDLLSPFGPPPPGEQGETNQLLTHFNTLIERFCPFSALFVILF